MLKGLFGRNRKLLQESPCGGVIDGCRQFFTRRSQVNLMETPKPANGTHDLIRGELARREKCREYLPILFEYCGEVLFAHLHLRRLQAREESVDSPLKGLAEKTESAEVTIVEVFEDLKVKLEREKGEILHFHCQVCEGPAEGELGSEREMVTRLKKK